MQLIVIDCMGMVGHSSLQIRAEEVDFWTIPKERLQLKEKKNLYPPRFVVEVCEGTTATTITFYFKGATKQITRGKVLTKG